MMKLHEASEHFSLTQNNELLAFVNEDVLAGSRYVFYETAPVTKTVMGYCTHCKNEFKVTQQLKHNHPCECYQCGTPAIAKQSFRGRSKMLDVAYIEYAERSLVDPNAIAVSGYYVYRDYRDDYRNVETGFIRLAMYIFKPGESHMWKRSKWDDIEGFKSFVKCKTVYSLGRSHMQNVLSYLSRESFTSAVQGTQFQYAQWEQYDSSRLLEYFELVCKYPIVEVLTKVGLRTVISDYLNKKTGNSLKWRAKTLDKIIGLPKSDWRQFKNLSSPISNDQLYILQQFRKEGETLPFQELYDICGRLTDWYSHSTLKLVQLTTGAGLRKISNYVRKQYELDKEHYGLERQVLITWNDYLAECQRTHVNLKDPRNMYPKNVRQLHQLQIERKKAIADMKLNLKIRKRAKELSEFNFSWGNLFIRPISSAQELADESNKLSHCVSTYADKYANSITDLFVIRNAAEKDVPFFTVEIKDGKVRQVRGLKNCSPTREVSQFMKKFEAAVLESEKVPVAV